jgi:hypothetical protein
MSQIYDLLGLKSRDKKNFLIREKGNQKEGKSPKQKRDYRLIGTLMGPNLDFSWKRRNLEFFGLQCRNYINSVFKAGISSQGAVFGYSQVSGPT